MISISNSVGQKKEGNRIWFLFECLECDKIIKIRKDRVNIHMGLCRECNHNFIGYKSRCKPFEALYNRFSLYCKRKGLLNYLKFDDFLNFTTVENCHYCTTQVSWTRFNVTRHGAKFNLDRKNNDEGYSLENCVVCCRRCNIGKSNKFSYEEWYGMTKYFREN
jgi:hypothetical protein